MKKCGEKKDKLETLNNQNKPYRSLGRASSKTTPREIIKGKSLIKWQDQKFKHIKRMDRTTVIFLTWSIG